MPKKHEEDASAQTDTSYKGWTNYSTWCVATRPSEDMEFHCHWKEITQATVLSKGLNIDVTDEDRNLVKAASRDLAEQLKQELQECIPLKESSIYRDLLQGAVNQVQWLEVADSYIACYCGWRPKQ